MCGIDSWLIAFSSISLSLSPIDIYAEISRLLAKRKKVCIIYKAFQTRARDCFSLIYETRLYFTQDSYRASREQNPGVEKKKKKTNKKTR